VITEFFVLRKYRRRHVGDQAARLLFERFAGPWEVPVFEANAPGTAFWASVIPRYAAADYRQSRTEWDGQPVVVWLFETHL
jgi:predicted acetyltransferase